MLCRGSTTVRPKIIGTTVVRGKGSLRHLVSSKAATHPGNAGLPQGQARTDQRSPSLRGDKRQAGAAIRVTRACSEGTKHKRIPGNRTTGQVGTAPKPQTGHLDRSANKPGPPKCVTHA